MEPVAELLRVFREDDRDTAFFNLIEMGGDTVPQLKHAFRREADPQIRAFILEVLRQHPDPALVPFLADSLHDEVPDVWKEALDVLVAIGTPEAVECLRSVRAKPCKNPNERAAFQEWIDEAIAQIDSLAAKAATTCE